MLWDAYPEVVLLDHKVFLDRFICTGWRGALGSWKCRCANRSPLPWCFILLPLSHQGLIQSWVLGLCHWAATAPAPSFTVSFWAIAIIFPWHSHHFIVLKWGEPWLHCCCHGRTPRVKQLRGERVCFSSAFCVLFVSLDGLCFLW